MCLKISLSFFPSELVGFFFFISSLLSRLCFDLGRNDSYCSMTVETDIIGNIPACLTSSWIYLAELMLDDIFTLV